MEHKQEVGHKEPLNAEQDVTFLHDFIAGGVAGSASVIVGHPFDTIKVSFQLCSYAVMQ
jgi:Mitochondrial carrier protein